jgi:uncharacterized peroxidase-related enzyme
MLERQQKHFGFVPNYAKIFTDRTDIMDLWAAMQAGIRRYIGARRFELVTVAAARSIGSSYCSLAHGKILKEKFLSPDEMHAIASGDYGKFSEDEAAMMGLARKVATDSSSVTNDDIDRLRKAGLGENEIFDVVAVAAARCFFAKLVDALGAQPDAPFGRMEEELRDLLTVGRPIAPEEPIQINPD